MTRSIGSPDPPIRSITLPMMNLADGDTFTARVYVPAGKQLDVVAAGAQTDTNTSPAGLTLEVDKESGGAVESTVVSATSARDEGNPLGSVAGGKTAAFRVENDTGAQEGCGGFAEYRLVDA